MEKREQEKTENVAALWARCTFSFAKCLASLLMSTLYVPKVVQIKED